MAFILNDKEYYNDGGVDIMAFHDFYPVGHQSGVTLIMNDKRALANGDVRFEQTPGQWQPVPKQIARVVDCENNRIITTLVYPDMDAHLHGFNPMIYPDFEFTYDVIVTGTEKGIEIQVDLDREIPKEFAGKLCFNMELFPGELFGRPWIMDDKTGIFPLQPNGPTMSQKANYENSCKLKPRENAKAVRELLAGGNKGYSPIIADDIIAAPYAVGMNFTVCPDDPTYCFTIRSMGNPLKLYDGRMNHNNGWFVVNCEIPENATDEAILIQLEPTVLEDWIREPVVQASQVGYHPDQPKKAIIELDKKDKSRSLVVLQKLETVGFRTIKEMEATEWGDFLRYHYLTFDFTEIKEPGLYRVSYQGVTSSVFRIDEDVFDQGVWQPVVEYFLPVQMCHMRVNEKYRVWHGLCHCDDARMAPVDYESFDGAAQGPETMVPFKPGDHIPGLDHGGWHDAGDFDLRIESQTGEMYHLAAAFEEFDAFLDETTIDQERRITEIHQPDGKNDILQQIEHGALSVVGAYRSMGRLYHEIMTGDLRKYVLLGDASTMTPGTPDNPEERLLFTEDNPDRDLQSAARLAGCYRALRGFNDDLAEGCLEIAKSLYEFMDGRAGLFKFDAYDPMSKACSITESFRIQAACELFLSTGDAYYRQEILSRREIILQDIERVGFIVCRVIHRIEDAAFEAAFRQAMLSLKEKLDKESQETPYGVPYRPAIWGAGWTIQTSACKYYFMHKAYPDIFDANFLYHSLQFILGVHPGRNTQSFASGVGSKSITTGYGANRADWSYIPGGVSSGTGLIRPDLPELLEFPFLWQQKEYVMGEGSSNYIFLCLAVLHALGR